MQRQRGDGHAVNTGVSPGVHHILQGEIKPKEVTLLCFSFGDFRTGVEYKVCSDFS